MFGLRVQQSIRHRCDGDRRRLVGSSSASGGSPAVGGSDTGGQSTGGAPASGGAEYRWSRVRRRGAVLPSDLFPARTRQPLDVRGAERSYWLLRSDVPGRRGLCHGRTRRSLVLRAETTLATRRTRLYDSRLAVVDDEVVQRLDETWRAVLKAPVAEGTGWIVPCRTESFGYGWYFEGEVTVPAGTFQNCWSRRLSPPEASPDIDTYCPGVVLRPSHLDGPDDRAGVLLGAVAAQ